MEWDELVKAGTVREDIFNVEDIHSAIHIGSGSHRVLASPWMITFMERTARLMLADLLPAGYSSVGVLVNVRHLAPTPVGSQIKTRAEVVSLDGSKVVFAVQALEGEELVGEGLHERVIIDEARFLKRVAAKAENNQAG